jgi:hypothetical protein
MCDVTDVKALRKGTAPDTKPALPEARAPDFDQSALRCGKPQPQGHGFLQGNRLSYFRCVSCDICAVLDELSSSMKSKAPEENRARLSPPCLDSILC